MATSSVGNARSYVNSLRSEIPESPEPPDFEQLSLLPGTYGGIDLAALRTQKRAIWMNRRLAPNTQRSYLSAWRAFNQWCQQAVKIPLPCSNETLCLYVTWMITEDRYRIASALVHINAVLDAHRRAGIAPPPSQDAFELVSALKRHRREHPLAKNALSVNHLVKTCKLAAKADDTNKARRDLAILLIGFATSLRRSELAALRFEDIKFRGPGVAVHVARSKNDQKGEGRTIGVWAGERVATDPVRALRRWMEVRGNWEGPLFCNVTRRDVILHQKMGNGRVADVVKIAVARAGLDPTGFGAHSLRSGAITAAADRGRSDRELMKLSGHRSVGSIKPYVRESEVFTGRNPLPGVL